MTLNRKLVFVLAALLSTCPGLASESNVTGKRIREAIKTSEYRAIDFSKVAGAVWSKVCFFGPYNESSENVLGFPWRVSEHTSALQSDGHNVIVFATDSELIEFVVFPRAVGDFWTLSGQCLGRENSQLIRDTQSKAQHNYVRKKSN